MLNKTCTTSKVLRNVGPLWTHC